MGRRTVRHAHVSSAFGYSPCKNVWDKRAELFRRAWVWRSMPRSGFFCAAKFGKWMKGAHLSKSTGKLCDVIADTDRYKASLYQFCLDLKAWRQFRSKFQLSWTKLRFEVGNQPMVPKERGIYAFTLALDPSALPEHGYILYMGITGDSSAGTLNSRYAQYLGDLKRHDGRPKVYNVLRRWQGDLFFSFVPIPDRRISLRKIESEFLSAVNPPINERDFHARISNARRAAF